MPSVGSLTVEIAADIAKLRSGVEETQARLASLERTTSTTGANMQAAMERSVAGINAAWVKMAAAAATAMQAWSFAEQAAGFQEQKDMLAGLAASYQTTADNILTSIQEASTGLISKTDAMNVALAGLTKGLSPKNLTDLAAAVDTLGDSVGKSATEAFKDLSEAIEKGTEKAIKLYIGAVDLDRVMSKLPNTATEYEKAQARLNAVLEHAASIQAAMGEAGDSAADKMDRFKVVVNDLKLALGSGLVSAGLATVSVFQGIVGAAFRVIEVANRLQALNPANSKTTKSYYEAHAQAAESTAAELFKDMRTNWEMAWKGAPTPKLQAAARITWKYDSAESMAKAQKEHEQAARREYQIFSDLQKHKIQLARETAIKNEQLMQWGYDHSAKTYEQENYLIQYKRAQAVQSSQIEQAALQAVIDKYGKSKDKQVEIAMVRNQLATAHQRQAEAEQTAVLAVMDMEERRFDQYVAHMTQINGSINDLQRGIDLADIAKGFEGTMAGTPFMNLINAMSDQGPYEKMKQIAEQAYQAQLDAVNEFSDAKLRILYDSTNRADILQRAEAQRSTMLDKAQYKQRLAIASAGFGTMAAVAQAYYAASENQSRAALSAYKVLAIAQATIDTIMAAQSSYAFGAKFGGPALGAAFAAVAIAAGLARVAQISAINPGTSTVSAGGPSSGVPVSAPTNDQNAASTTAITEKAQAVPNIQIYVQGNIIDQDKFARELLPSIRKAWSDNG